jgi:hypothetical protein
MATLESFIAVVAMVVFENWPSAILEVKREGKDMTEYQDLRCCLHEEYFFLVHCDFLALKATLPVNMAGKLTRRSFLSFLESLD